ncbi:pyridoxal phosphate-dependent transferase [Xylariomycetidae sp. FL0641]|nr:pyridoxal phosphate-dependent transferase [Xylariomycetidae sp. FL0641]
MAPSATETITSPVLSVKSPEVSKSDAARQAYDAAVSRFVTRNPVSRSLFDDAISSMPGGNTRTQLHTAPFPVFMKSGQGVQVTSEDGHVYTDLVGELTAALYGHSHPVIVNAIADTIQNVGLSLGATTKLEQVHAREICSRFSLERVRFTNSGTEANINALAGARAFTGKRKVVVFGGGYHGGVYSFAGGKPAANNIDRDDFVVAQYNNIESAVAAIQSEGVAAVLLEGMQGACGAVPATQDFLGAVEATAKEAGVLFILDEVMTSRVAPGGLASLRGLKPDLKILGKYLGGGLSFGAFGGRADVMAVYDPRNSGSGKGGAGLAHHGTFNNNTLSLGVGHAGLTQVYTPAVCTAFNAQGERFRGRLAEVTRGSKLCFTGVGSLLCSHFAESGQQDVRNEDDIQENWMLKDLFWYEMMEQGFWIVRRGSISLMLDTPASELDRFVECVADFLERHAGFLRV